MYRIAGIKNLKKGIVNILKELSLSSYKLQGVEQER